MLPSTRLVQFEIVGGKTKRDLSPPPKLEPLTFAQLSFRPVRTDPIQLKSTELVMLQKKKKLLNKKKRDTSRFTTFQKQPQLISFEAVKSEQPVFTLSISVCVYVWITFGPLNASMLVVTQEESFSAAALIAAHHVDTNLLASAIAFWTLVNICQQTSTHKKINKITSRQEKYYTDYCFCNDSLSPHHSRWGADT